MTNLVVKVYPKQTLEKMAKYYLPHSVSNPPTGALFQAKLKSVTITAYTKSAKVMFQGIDALNESAFWQGGVAPLAKSTSPSPVNDHPYSPPANIGELSHIGTDEAGSGDYFGPLTVAAAYVDQAWIPKLLEIGVRDSKLLSDKQIIEMAKYLKPSIPFSLLVLGNEKYNEMQAKGYTQGKLKAVLHEKAFQNLLKKLPEESVEAILIDQFCLPEVYFAHTKTPRNRKPPVYFVTKAESISIAVATASILARAAFLKHMALIGDNVNNLVPKGAGAKVDQFAADVIQSYGESTLKNITKWHFANTEKARKLVNKG